MGRSDPRRTTKSCPFPAIHEPAAIVFSAPADGRIVSALRSPGCRHSSRGTIRTASSSLPLIRRKPICKGSPSLNSGRRRSSMIRASRPRTGRTPLPRREKHRLIPNERDRRFRDRDRTCRTKPKIGYLQSESSATMVRNTHLSATGGTRVIEVAALRLRGL